jgi:hypothetical protein
MNERTYDLEYDTRVAPLHLGERKYTTPSRAIGELVANAFDADASRVDVDILRNALGGDEAIRVSDDGHGIRRQDITRRFARVGVPPAEDGEGVSRFAQFGVGRFAVHKLGSVAVWRTVCSESSEFFEISLKLEAARPGKLTVHEQPTGVGPTGTSVEIWDLCEPESSSLSPSRLAGDIAAQFCAFLLGNPSRRIFVQGDLVNPFGLIDRETAEEITISSGRTGTLRHIVLRSTVDRSRFPEPLLFSAKGQTVATAQPDFPVSPQYLALVECASLEEIVTTNREALVELDPVFQELKAEALVWVKTYQSQLRESHARLFLREARGRDYYPFKGAPDSALARAQRVVYDAALTEVNQQVNIEGMTQRQQAVVFRLLKRALENEDLLDILGELINVPDAQLKKFRQVLSRSTLDSIVRLSSEVAGRLDYLDQLHELIYGSAGKHVLERAHLHKLLEPSAWLFGEAFHLATSDKAFRTVIKRIRELVGFASVDEATLEGITGTDLIPDLFLAADKEYKQAPKHRRLLVEIKAPGVPIGKKEIDQIEKYAQFILKSAEFDHSSAEWDLFLVSANIEPDVEWKRESPDRPDGMIAHVKNVRVWVFRWSEIIERARDELRFVREHLERKSKELDLDYWSEEFPEIVEEIKDRQTTAELKKTRKVIALQQTA